MAEMNTHRVRAEEENTMTERWILMNSQERSSKDKSRYNSEDAILKTKPKRLADIVIMKDRDQLMMANLDTSQNPSHSVVQRQ